MQELTCAFGGAWGTEHLSAFGQRCGSAEVSRKCDEVSACRICQPTEPHEYCQAHATQPVFVPYDRNGHRQDLIQYCDAYHDMFRLGIEEGQTGAFVAKNKRRGSYVVRGVASMLMYQAEPGVSCPLTMTAAAIPCLRAGNTNSNKLIDEWVNKLETPVYAYDIVEKLLAYAPSRSFRYDGRNIPVSEKAGISVGMSMTEKQGGSDVRTNSTTATRLSDSTLAAYGDMYTLRGHKWYVGVPLVLPSLAHTLPAGSRPRPCPTDF